MGQFEQSYLILELNKKILPREEGDQLEEIFNQLHHYHLNKTENNKFFKKLILLLRCTQEMHEYLLGMLNKQKKLAGILEDIQPAINHYFYQDVSSKKMDINLLLSLLKKLSAFYPYPILNHILKNNDLMALYIDYENYLIQLYLLFSEENDEKNNLIDYLFMQIQLGLLYENNVAFLSDFINNYSFAVDFLAKHHIHSRQEILQLLIEPVQYFPRFLLLLNKLIDEIGLFKFNIDIDFIKMLNFIRDKITCIVDNLNKFLHCLYPEEIHLYFLKKTITESLSKKMLQDNERSLIESYIEQTLRADRLRILNNYMQLFFVCLSSYQDQHRSYWGLFNASQDINYFFEEWKKFTPEYVKIYSENLHKKEKASLIFQQGVIKLYEKSIQLLTVYYEKNTETINKNSLGHFMLGYILHLEETISRIIDNSNYVPNLATININIYLEKAGKDNIEIKNKCDYYRSLHDMLNTANNQKNKIA